MCSPSQIEQILMEIEETQPHYQIIIDRGETHLDNVELRVEVEPEFFSDETRELERISREDRHGHEEQARGESAYQAG